MTPAQPPFPTAWNFPFQPDAGNHTSILMSESLVGASVAATRQNAGRSLNGFAPRPPPARPSAAGGVNAPGATDCEDVIVACGSDSDFRLSHVAPAARPAADAKTMRLRTTLIFTFTSQRSG